jgi:hypothetical protein
MFRSDVRRKLCQIRPQLRTRGLTGRMTNRTLQTLLMKHHGTAGCISPFPRVRREHGYRFLKESLFR